MIQKEFSLSEPDLYYTVLINKINLNQDNLTIDSLFQIIEILQNKYKNSIIQFFNDFYVLNENHIFKSIYFVQKAFKKKECISNKQSIEFLLYLSTKRQIKIAIESFGIKDEDLEKGILNYCIVSSNYDINKINLDLLKNFNYDELEFNLNKKSFHHYNRIKNFFELSKNQIKTILNSMNLKESTEDLKNVDINQLYIALNDLICEKMVLLGLEAVKSD